MTRNDVIVVDQHISVGIPHFHRVEDVVQQNVSQSERSEEFGLEFSYICFSFEYLHKNLNEDHSSSISLSEATRKCCETS